MKKVIFFDVDNTLICREKNKICESTIKALEMCKNNGVELAIATGRSLAMLRQEGLDKLADIIISSNGSMVTIEEAVIYEQSMEDKKVKKLLEKFKAQRIPYVLHMKEHSYGTLEHPWVKELSEKYNMSFEEVGETTQAVYQLNAQIREDQLEELRKVFKTFRFVPLIDLKDGYDIFNVACNKGSGIKQVKALYEDKSYRYYCFGDGFNDFEMFEEVDYAIAMGNGCEALKAKANYVTESISKQGIYKALKKLSII
ncbi:MAG: Cof-type HAD-IIB family hydrolase [Cellulosilyticaceae bacterium]